MTINFYLNRRPDRKGYMQIFLYIRLNKRTLSVYTGEKILPEDWNKKNQRPKKDAPGAEDLSNLLQSLEDEINELKRNVRSQVIHEKGKKPRRKELTIEYLRSNLSFIDQKDRSFWGLWDEYVKEKTKVRTGGTIKQYGVTWRTLQVINGTHPKLDDPSFEREREFIKKYGKYTIEFASLNKDFVERLKDFYRHMGFVNSMCNQKLGRVKTFMDWALENDYISDDNFRKLKTGLPVPDSKANIYFLMADELAKLTHMNIEKDYLARVRDVFCFGCYSGLRYSDIENLKKSNILGDEFEITMIKTRKKLNNPLFEPAKAILAKYKDLPGPYALPVISNQKMNDYLKELGVLAELDRKITLVDYIGPDRIEDVHPLHEILATHVARKTFVTYLINSGMDKNMVMAYTGHSGDIIDRYYEILADYKKREAEKVNKMFKKDRKANGRMAG